MASSALEIATLCALNKVILRRILAIFLMYMLKAFGEEKPKLRGAEISGRDVDERSSVCVLGKGCLEGTK